MKKENGNSLIEVIIALAIFTWFASSLTSLALGSLALATSTSKHSKAEFLAQEGMEIVNVIKSRAWNELNINQSGLQIIDNEWYFAGEGTSEQIGEYSRTIFLSDVFRDENYNIVPSTSPQIILDTFSKKVKAKVTWTSARNAQNYISYQSIVSNWDSLDWTQNDWSGGNGQSIWSITDRYDSQDSNMETGVTGQLTLVDIGSSTLANIAYLDSSAFDMGEYSQANSIYWTGSIPNACSVCEIQIRIKTAPDNAGSPGTWSSTWCGPNGENGDSLDYYSSSSTKELIHTDHNEDRWIKYRITLLGDSIDTPILESITINYKQ